MPPSSAPLSPLLGISGSGKAPAVALSLAVPATTGTAATAGVGVKAACTASTAVPGLQRKHYSACCMLCMSVLSILRPSSGAWPFACACLRAEQAQLTQNLQPQNFTPSPGQMALSRSVALSSRLPACTASADLQRLGIATPQPGVGSSRALVSQRIIHAGIASLRQLPAACPVLKGFGSSLLFSKHCLISRSGSRKLV